MRRSETTVGPIGMALCAMLIVMTAGCAAIGTRIIHMEPFAGVKTDYAMCFHRDGIDPQCRIHPAFAVIDAPFSFVTDLLFLPWDIGHNSGHSLSHPPPIARDKQTEDKGLPNQASQAIGAPGAPQPQR